jgi:hypothetical protein
MIYSFFPKNPRFPKKRGKAKLDCLEDEGLDDVGQLLDGGVDEVEDHLREES